MRILLIDFDKTGLDMAWLAASHDHDVRWWMPTNADKSPIRTGDGFHKNIVKVKEWQSSMKWVGKDGLVINLFNDPKITKELDTWRAFGYKIFGPTAKSAELEIKRNVGMEYFKELGFHVPKYHTFQTLEATLAFAWKADQPYVLKPMGDEADKSLTYVAHDPADLVSFLELKKSQGFKSKGQLMLQEKVDLIMELGISGWMGKDGFLNAKNVNIEHKKLMPGDFGPSTGEMGCYSSDTEVLTDSGWKFWPDVSKEDRIASLVDGKTVFQHPSEVVSFDYVGPMISWENQTIDIFVTPNHNMYVNGQSAARRCDDSKYHFRAAEDCIGSQYEVMRTADWGGGSPEFYVLPERRTTTKVTSEKSYPMIPWAKFIGIATADGWFGDKTICIAKSHPEKFSKVEKILIECGLHYMLADNGYHINSTQIAQHFSGFGRSWEKRVPDFIKNGSKEVITAFLEGYALGDGNMQPNGFRIFYTTSEGLADDVQELLLKIGRVGVIKKRDRVGKVNIAPDGHEIISRRVSFEIVERVKKTRSWLDARDRKIKMYSGKVYCATVPGHIMYVRRNGKPVWCGNTVMKYFTDTDDSLLNDFLMRFEEPLMKLGHIGDFDIGGAVTTKGDFVPFEVSARFGWPSTFILFKCHKGDPVQWMYDAVSSGVDSLEVDERCAIGAIMAQPPFPKMNEHPADSVGAVVTGLEDVWDHISPVELMIEEGPVMKDGKVSKGLTYKTTGDYICCVTALGHDVHDAIAGVYSAAERVKFQDRILRNDIGKDLEKKIPKVKALGYEELPDF